MVEKLFAQVCFAVLGKYTVPADAEGVPQEDVLHSLDLRPKELLTFCFCWDNVMMFLCKQTYLVNVVGGSFMEIVGHILILSRFRVQLYLFKVLPIHRFPLWR